MSGLTKYRVLRAHDGDRPYAEGDVREAKASEVKHLVPHVLQPIRRAKAAAPHRNKAEGASPANKADNGQ